MACLQNRRFKYHDDLEGLCLICNDYAYQPFEDLIKLVLNNIMNKKIKNELITQLEMLHHHLKKNYENKLLVHNNGTTKHFNAVLDKLDDHETIIVVDYKTRILSVTARKTKSKFFGKEAGHFTQPLFFKKNNEKMDVQVYDHWSYDMKQDA
ncbi:hypothetical protein C1646_778234 [Rhizophagus diaphanus]|nr:hypothetical protein C1646_778234 [Rhizophagus diaphanus] [Rhizophagus sp. MUCL 43196]